MFSSVHYRNFLSHVGDLISTPEVQSMRTIPHHPGNNCYEHSVYVAYVSYRLSLRWHLDHVAAARAGLLHDLYLYRPKERGLSKQSQCFAHPKAALDNARTLCGNLSKKEENAILSHMWPVSRRMPRYREAFVVNLADKVCAAAEVFRLYQFFLRRDARRRVRLTA